MDVNENLNPNRKKILWGLTIAFLIIGAVLLVLWVLIFRFHEKTDDAYVNGNMVVVTPQISGYITAVTVDETDLVEEGHVLVRLDSSDTALALERAKSELAEAVRTVAQMFENVQSLRAQVEISKAEMAKTGKDYEHRKKMIGSGAVSLEDFQHSEAYFIEAFAGLLAAQHNFKAAEVMIEGTTIETHPLVESAKARTKEAYLNLQRCTIRSPVKGLVTNKAAQVGEAIFPESSLMTIVPLDQIWVDANYKENQLRNIRIGQPVKLTSDLYGSDVVYHGEVIGIGAATGSVLSVLPPQNATGNWIKIVQRLPARIRLAPDELQDHPLRLGLSMNVEVNIKDTSGMLVPAPIPSQELYATSIFEEQAAGADALIARIIAKNYKGGDGDD